MQAVYFFLLRLSLFGWLIHNEPTFRFQPNIFGAINVLKLTFYDDVRSEHVLLVNVWVSRFMVQTELVTMHGGYFNWNKLIRRTKQEAERNDNRD